jgi:hypothetical protein
MALSDAYMRQMRQGPVSKSMIDKVSALTRLNQSLGTNDSRGFGL